MRILIIGATGTIGRPIAEALEGQHDVIRASHRNADLRVDIADPQSIAAMYDRVGNIDAVICAAGNAAFKPLTDLTDEDFTFSLGHKLMGQVNVIRHGLDRVSDGGAFLITSGVLSHDPMPGSAAVSLVNAALEGFTRAAALEAPRGIRVNCISPPCVTETLIKFKMDPSIGVPAATVAKTYIDTLFGGASGQVVLVPRRS